MAPDKLILTAISKQDKADEIQRRLQSEEAEKARKLLAMAMSHKDALFFTKNLITQQIEELNNYKDNSNNTSGNNNTRK